MNIKEVTKITIINILKGLLYMSIFSIIYIVVEKINKRFNKKIEEAQYKESTKYQSIRRLETYIKNKKEYKSHYEKIQIKLKKMGNPLKLTPVTYYISKVGLTLIVLIFGAFSKNNIVIVIGIAVFGYFFVDILYYLSNQDDNKKIIKELPDICDTLDIQTAANVQLGVALTEIYDIPSNKRLKKDLSELAAEINLTKNPEQALDNIIDKYDLVEMDVVILAIKQSLISGKSREILNNQSEMLGENNIFMIQEETGKLDLRLLFIATMLFAGGVAMIVFSFSVQIQENLRNIFQ